MNHIGISATDYTFQLKVKFVSLELAKGAVEIIFFSTSLPIRMGVPH